MKSVFITGGSGFLGKHLINNLKKKKFKIYAPSSKEINLRRFSDIKNLKNRFDYIFHLASWTQAGDFCLKYPADQWVINQEINTNLINWWFKNGNINSHLVLIGTSCCYDEKGTFSEKNYLYEKPHESLQTYAMTKKMLVQGAISCEKQKGFSWNCYVPSTLYGTRYNIGNKIPHFIFDLVKKIIRGKVFGDNVILWGDGYQKREIIHVDDFIRNMISIDKKYKNQIFNLGGEYERSIRYFARIISKYIKYDFNKINFDKKRYVGAKGKKLSNSKITKINKNYKKELIPINKGIQEMVNWHIKNKQY